LGRGALCYDGRLRIGIHTSAAGGLANAAREAAELGVDTFQMFTSSPRMWRGTPPRPDDVAQFKKLRERHGLYPAVVHDNYLINLASADAGIRAKSVAAFRGELERAVMAGVEYLVAHPGNYKGQTVEQGLVAFVAGVVEAAQGLRTDGLMLLLENTAGQGSSLGRRFGELALIRQLAGPHTDLAIGYCLDTCHMLASGYDVATEAGLEAAMAEAERELGLANVHVMHANDSRGALGSHVDRHEHIGKGHIGIEGFRRILHHDRLRDKAFILETPVDEPGDGLRNIAALRNLCPKRPMTPTRSN